MSSYSATDAAFEGYRLTREKPKAFLFWVGFNLIARLVAAVVLITFAGEHLAALEKADFGKGDFPVQDLVAILPATLILLPFDLLISSVMAGAVFRSMWRPEASAGGYLRFGADELRLMLLTVLLGLMFFLLVVVVTVAAGMIAAFANFIVPPVAGLVALGVSLSSMGFLLFVGVRLSLAGAITFSESKLSLFDSWRLTRGHFWRLLGVYALTIATYVVVFVLILIIATAVMFFVTGGDIKSAGAMFRSDVSSLSTYFGPAAIANSVFGAVTFAIFYPVIIAPGAVIYRALASRDAI